jgi:hypothetical protein
MINQNPNLLQYYEVIRDKGGKVIRDKGIVKYIL